MEDFDDDKLLDYDVHLYVTQRRGTKCTTTVEGIPGEFDYKKILKYWKKCFSCNGSIAPKEDKKGNKDTEAAEQMIITVTGDHRDEISKFLEEQGIALKERIKKHGA